MSETYPGKDADGSIRFKGGGAADWLRLAAAPVFATMAALTGALGGDPPNPLCAVAQNATPLSGMVLMYLLMSVFHSAPWLTLASHQKQTSSLRPPSTFL